MHDGERTLFDLGRRRIKESRLSSHIHRKYNAGTLNARHVHARNASVSLLTI